MSINERSARRLSRKATIALLIAALALANASAFGDFVPTETKVLGVGRIQSTSSAVPVAATERLVLAPSEEEAPVATSVIELAAPIDRELVSVNTPDTVGEPAATSQDSGVGEWQTGLASAYGGPREVGAYMANGEILGPDDMGVAVPVSWWRLLGHHMEVEYNGIVVTVVVADTGPFAQWGRSLDLQPGVWKAFGFDSLWDWGVREVRFRVID